MTRSAFVLSTLFVAISSPAAQIRPFVIYGDDGRVDLIDVSSPIQRAQAKATVAIVDEEYLKELPSGDFSPVTETYKEYANLCEGERFADQGVFADCSGFLIAEDLVMTAGHCVPEHGNCDDLRFVFDYAIDTKNKNLSRLPRKNIYSCTEVVAWSKEQARQSDFAIMRLDRKVTDREPLELNLNKTLKSGDELYVIGHPVGLPTKVASGANVRTVSSQRFKANLDTFEGNSGSAVLNARTHKVEGILVEGEQDFVEKSSCSVEYRCSDNACRGEDSVPLSSIAKFIPRR